jgi:serine/threonine protein kinase
MSSPAEPGKSPRSARTLGRYEILFELARGGMGTVYVGRLVGAHGFDRLVAIKRLIPGEADAADVNALLAEARVSARIRHPNVVQTLELGEHEGTPFVVMQLVEGVSLARLLRTLNRRKEALDQDLAAWIIAQVATGLHAAHELQSPSGEPLHLVHRDVSPQNVLLSFSGQVYVADFGIAKVKDTEVKTQSGVVKGKFAYMSPEQARAEPLDRRSDVFSTGILLYEALTGKRLFAGESPAETILRIVEGKVPSPLEKRPELSPDLAEIALMCLKKRREERFDSASALAAALRTVLRERGASVDQGQLAELLDALFAEDREKLTTRIREAVVSAEHPAVPSGTEPSASDGQGSIIATIDTARWRRPAWPSIGLLGGLVVLVVFAAWGITRFGSHEGASSAAVSAESAVPPSSQPESSGAQRAALVAPLPEPSTEDAALPSAAPAAPSSKPAPTRIVVRKAAAPKPSTTTAKPTTTPPPASADRGRPFGTL